MSESGKKSAAHPKVFDIMRPSKVQPSASSRPIIVGHGPEVHDSTLTEKPVLATDKLLAVAEHKPVPEHNPEHNEVPAAPDESTAQVEVAEPPITPATSEAQPTAPPAETETSVQPAPEPEQPEASADKPTDTQQPEPIESEEPASVVQPVVSFHHKHAGKHPWRWLVVLVIILALAAAAFDILLDAGTITITNVPHTHFLQQ